MTRLLAAGVLFLLGATLPHAAEKRPNILWLIIEDACADFGCYGNPDVRTPRIDRFAQEGQLFRHAFATASVCSPSRSAFMTGVFQTRFGGENHRSHRSPADRRPPGVRLITERLREAGYFTANIRDLPAELGFKGADKTDWNFYDDGKAFDGHQWSELKQKQPFYAQINFHETHRPYYPAKENPADPAKVRLPPYLADDPVVRADWASYLDELARVDAKVGKMLDLIEREGLRENTVVFLFADHGREDFRGKYYAYEQGFAVPLIVRWPAQLKPGSANDALVSLLDVSATSLAIAGLEPPGLDGVPLFGPRAKSRPYVYGARERIDDTPDRVRRVRDARYSYIRNFEPERPYLQRMAYAEVTNPSYNRMRELFTAGKLTPEQARFLAPHRPPEELYDLQRDPYELHNLAGQPGSRAELERLRATLAAWQKDTGDEAKRPENPAEVGREMEILEKSVQRMRQTLGLGSNEGLEKVLEARP
jgi:N-sulfoglucosamine sulfohydrolase